MPNELAVYFFAGLLVLSAGGFIYFWYMSKKQLSYIQKRAVDNRAQALKLFLELEDKILEFEIYGLGLTEGESKMFFAFLGIIKKHYEYGASRLNALLLYMSDPESEGLPKQLYFTMDYAYSALLLEAQATTELLNDFETAVKSANLANAAEADILKLILK